jgi:hypothetical protein
MDAVLPVGPGRVEIRCEDCAADLGRSAPVLIVAARYMGIRDVWRWELIGIGARRPQARPTSRPIGGLVTSNTSVASGGRATNQHRVRGQAVELACRRCKRHGWRGRRRLYELADLALAERRGDAYLSLV